MESLNQILGDRDFSQPVEIDQIKQYIWDKYKAKSVVSFSGKSIVIGVNSSSLVGILRYKLPEIKRELRINQKVLLKISR